MSISSKPYLLRALHEWCTDNGFTPYLSVQVGDGVQVPRQYAKDGQIVLNIGFEATQGLRMENEFIFFQARFGGVAQEIIVPVSHVLGIFAKENGQGMAFAFEANVAEGSATAAPDPSPAPAPKSGRPSLTIVK